MTEKPLIIISSRTGNTLAVGHAVCDALPGAAMMRHFQYITLQIDVFLKNDFLLSKTAVTCKKHSEVLIP